MPDLEASASTRPDHRQGFTDLGFAGTGAGGDAFEFAEERRLFYVALTRARSTVTLVTVTHKESPFITELIKDYAVGVFDADGSASSNELCPTCGAGFLVPRKSKFGPFMGCSNYPKCKHTLNFKSEPMLHQGVHAWRGHPVSLFGG